MEDGGFFYQALVYLSAAVITIPIAKKAGLGSVLGYLIAGVIIGPFVLGLAGENREKVMHFAEFGVVMMLFLVGLELNPKKLWKLKVPILGMGGSQVGITALVITFFTFFVYDKVWQESLAVGLTLALSSTAIILQTMQEKNLLKTEAGQNTFSVLLFQDMAIIPILAVFPLLATYDIPASSDAHAVHTWTENYSVFAKITVGALAVVGIIFLGKYIIDPILRIVAATKQREIFIASALLLVIFVSVLMVKVGLSPALGAFIAGVILAGSEFRHALESDIEPLKGLLLGLFFLAVGASIDFSFIAQRFDHVAIAVLMLIVGKFVILFGIGEFFKMGRSSSILFGVALAQGSEFAFVLLSFGLQNGVISQNVSNLLISSVAITMALTPLLIGFNEKIMRKFSSSSEGKNSKESEEEIKEENEIIIAGFGVFGSTVGRFLQANKIGATYLDNDPMNVGLLRKLGIKVYYGDSTKLDLLLAAGAKHAKIMVITHNNFDNTIDTIKMVKKHFPHIKIIAKASEREEYYRLANEGIEHTYLEPFDTSLRMASDILNILGMRKYRAQKTMQFFRQAEQKSLDELAKLHENQKDYLFSARQKIEDMDKLIRISFDDLVKRKLSWNMGEYDVDDDSFYKNYKRKSYGDKNKEGSKKS